MTDAAQHDALYDAAYYARDVEGPALAAAPVIAKSIISSFRPTSVVDVGCGTGALLAALRDQGVTDLCGYEYSKAALDWCESRKLFALPFDIARDGPRYRARTYDVAVSLEVAEHLPKSAADILVGLLCRLSRTVIFSAAPPGQGGLGHVNEQPAQYWIDRFAVRGYGHPLGMTGELRTEWMASGCVAPWYYENLLVFGAWW